jgi:hypothetical protein
LKPALGQDFEAKIAALLGPFVMLFGQDGANQPDHGGAIGKNADDVGAAADLPIEPLLISSSLII